MNFLKACAFVAVSLILAVSAEAGKITGYTWSSGVGSVGAHFIPIPAPANNDDVPGVSPNEIYLPQKSYMAVGPVDIEYTVDPSRGVTEYHFREGLFNGTGIPFTDYHMQLGFGMGTAFVPSPSGDGLDFDFPDMTSPVSMGPFTTVVVAEDSIDAYNGVVPPGMYVAYLHFHIDVPDGIGSFTIRQYPTIDTVVPEPSGLMLTGMSVLGLLRRWRLVR